MRERKRIVTVTLPHSSCQQEKWAGRANHTSSQIEISRMDMRTARFTERKRNPVRQCWQRPARGCVGVVSFSLGQEQDTVVPQKKEDLPNYKECTRPIQSGQLIWCYQKSGHENWKRCLNIRGELPLVTLDFHTRFCWNTASKNHSNSYKEKEGRVQKELLEYTHNYSNRCNLKLGNIQF